MKAVVFYESAADLADKAPLHFAAHRARWKEFAGRGELLMIGPFDNALQDGAMGIFTTRAAAEEFVRGDPFVLNGVVRNWIIRDWNEALVPDQPAPPSPTLASSADAEPPASRSRLDLSPSAGSVGWCSAGRLTGLVNTTRTVSRSPVRSDPFFREGFELSGGFGQL